MAGSLRVFARQRRDNRPPRSAAVAALLEREAAAGVTTP